MARRGSSLPYEAAIKALDAFTRCQVPYVIVGGTALALHGIPRSTLDVDIVVPAQTETIVRVFKAAKSAGLESQQARILSLAQKPNLVIGQWVSFRDREKRELIDVFFEKEGQFNKLHKHSIERRGRETTFRIASLRDLEKMKEISGRPIDLADVALIQEIKKIKKSKKSP